MNKDQIEGRSERATGKLKELAGRAIGSRKMEREGQTQCCAGRIRASYGDLLEDLRKVGRK